MTTYFALLAIGSKFTFCNEPGFASTWEKIGTSKATPVSGRACGIPYDIEGHSRVAKAV